MLCLVLVQAGHDFYRVLRIPWNATNAEIKRAHRKQSLLYHPDRAASAEEKRRFAERQQLLNDAVDVLLNRDRRAMYDRIQYRNGMGEEELRRLGGNPAVPLDQAALDMDSAALQNSSVREKADAQETQLSLTFKQCMDGVFEHVTLNRTVANPECHPAGHKCVYCGGSGRRPGRPELAPGEPSMERRPCPFCAGLGHPLADCGPGNATVQEAHFVLVIVQAGVPDGYALTVEGEGSADPDDLSLPVGDLRVTVRCAAELEHEGRVFRRTGQDLLVDVEISAEEAKSGFSLDLSTPAGEAVRITQSSSVHDGQELVFDGKGFPSFEGSGRGRFVVTLRVRP